MMKRDSCLDIVKGSAILLMVFGHCCLPTWLTKFIYSFHMLVFFLVAGIVFSLRHGESIRNVCVYVGSRLMRLWIPFVVWCSVFAILHNLLLELNVYSNADEFLSSLIGVQSEAVIRELIRNGVVEVWSVKYVARQILESLAFLYTFNELNGTFWFLKLIFYSSCGYCVSSYVLKKIHIDVALGQTVFCTVLFVAGKFFKFYIAHYFGGGEPLLPYALFHVGYCIKRYAVVSPKKGMRFVCMVFIASVGAMLLLNYILLSANYWWHGLRYVFLAISGYYMLWSCSCVIVATPVAGVLAYLGRHTMPIVLLHFSAFKVVSVVLVALHRDPAWRIAMYPIAYTSWIARAVYLVFGIVLPLAAAFVYHKVVSWAKVRIS